MYLNTILPLFIGFQEIAVIILVAIVVFGPKKIPEIARGLGQGVRAMREATDEIKREIMESADEVVPTKEITEAKNKIQSQIDEAKEEIDNHLGSVKREM